MMFRKTIFSISVLCAVFLSLHSCKKTTDSSPVPPAGSYVLKYPDSIFYLRNQSNDYIVNPLELRPGRYYGFPEGIEIDEATGAINVNKSESGLRYRITHVSPTNDSTTTLIVISGITYPDKFYRLSTGDSMANPVYNASASRILPVNGSIFDDGNGANSGGCSIKTDDAKINLKQCVRNGIFGATPTNDVRKDFDIFYRLNDNSGKAQNKLKVRLYYYDSMADVAPDLLQTLQDRQQEGVFLGGKLTAGTTGTLGRAKPRPPCIIILGN